MGMKMGNERQENVKKERKQKKNEREEEWEGMKAVSGWQNGKKRKIKRLLGFDFWNGWWRLKRKNNGQDQFSRMGMESWAQVGPKLKWNEPK